MQATNKYDRYLSPDRDFQSGPYKTKTRYILCSSPRVGSTLLGQMLRDTNQAGDPLEYLNQNYFNALLRRSNDISSFHHAYNLLERYRTSSNGVFGLQLHWSHFNQFFQEKNVLMDEFFRKFDKIVFLRRRNRVEQAISLYRASLTKLWSSIDEDNRNAHYYENENFDPIAITKFMHSAIAQDQGWINYLELKGKEYLTIYYEDIIDNWESEGKMLLKYLINDETPIPKMGLRQQRPDNDLTYKKFTDYLGCKT